MKINSIRRLTISSMVIAIYIVVLYITQGMSFGPYQIRIATSLYALAYIFPFLVIPMGIANLIANFLFGGLGWLDCLGGFGVGIITTMIIVGLKRRQMNLWWSLLPIVVVPAVCVSAWLAYVLHIPYTVLLCNLSVGQVIPAVVGCLLVQLLKRRLVLPIRK